MKQYLNIGKCKDLRENLVKYTLECGPPIISVTNIWVHLFSKGKTSNNKILFHKVSLKILLKKEKKNSNTNQIKYMSRHSKFFRPNYGLENVKSTPLTTLNRNTEVQVKS